MPDILTKIEEVNQRLDAQVIIDSLMFSQIVDALPDGLLVVNEKGIIQLVNQQIELMFGYPRSMLVGESVQMLLPSDRAPVHAAHIGHYFANPTVRPMNLANTLPARHRSGRMIDVQISLGPIVSAQGVLALALVRRVTRASQNATG